MNNKRRKKNAASGFTLVEILISLALFAVIALIIGTFIRSVFDYQLLFSQQLSAQHEIEQTFTTMMPEIHSMVPSALGSYAIAQAATSSLTFFTDIDADGIADQVRYLLNGTTLQKGIIAPSGNPPAYVSANEIVTDVAHDVVADAPLFTYYDAAYTGSEPAMSYPIIISDIRLINITLTLKDPNKTVPVSASVEIVPRNLRTNL